MASVALPQITFTESSLKSKLSLTASPVNQPATTPSNSRQLKRPRMSPDSPIRDLTSLKPADLELFLRCFVMDLEDGDDLTDEDLKALSNLSPRLQGTSFSRKVSRLTYDKSKPETSNVPSPICSTGLCEPHQCLSYRLVKSMFDNLFGLIFYPPPPLDPVVHRTGFTMVIAGMRSVINKKEDEVFGWLDESVFKPCMACACRKLLSEDQFLYTILLSAYCTDPPSTEVSTILETIWDLLPSLRPDYTVHDVKFWVNSAFEESQEFRLAISKSNIEIEYVEIAAPDTCLA